MDVHKFEFRLVINETPTWWWPVERSCDDRGSPFFIWYILFSPDRRCEF